MQKQLIAFFLKPIRERSTLRREKKKKRNTLKMAAASFPMELPAKPDALWSSWYREAEDTFADFATFEPQAAANANGGHPIPRALSARQISGQFDDDVARNWEEDWEDEDTEDTYEAIMGKIQRYEVSTSAAQNR